MDDLGCAVNHVLSCQGNVDHAMICKRSGFVIQRHNELKDLEAEMLHMVCNGVEIETVLQDITGEELNRGANTAPDARLDIVARGFWERDRSPFFDVRICHPNADFYRDMELSSLPGWELELIQTSCWECGTDFFPSNKEK